MQAACRIVLTDECRVDDGDTVNLATIGQAIAAFVVTNIDDLLMLAVFFGQVPGHRHAAMRVIAGQYLGFTAILVVSISGAFLGATLLPAAALPYLGLVPIALGLRAAWTSWCQYRRTESSADDDASGPSGPRVWHVAGVTFANGGDNIGVYVPMFAVAAIGTVAVYVAVFLIAVGLWCAAARYFALHPLIAKAFSRWGHIILPVALLTIGTTILIEGGVFAR